MPTAVMNDGATLHYEVEGSGEPALAFLHGWCSNLRHWQPQAEHFRGSHRVVRVDRRGMGRSVVEEPAGSARRHADDLAAVLDVAGVPSAVVVGHAGGATSALTFAVAYPERTRGVVVVDSPMVARPRFDDPTDGFGSLLASMIAALDGPDGAAALRGFYNGYFGPTCDPAISAAAIADALETPLAVASAELRWAIGDADAAALAEQITAPVLWLTATPPDAALLHSKLRDVTIGVVAGSGHFPQLEVPAQTNAMIETFLAQLVRT